MKSTLQQTASRFAVMAAALAIIAMAPQARANVYASNIKLNGSLNGTLAQTGSSVTISYILNEAATRGATINILSGNTVVDTINIASGNPGTLRGTNSVVWGGTNSSGGVLGAGAYTVSITAAATGYTNWTQISVDGTNTAAVYPLGMAVDNNTNSAYYGRVVVGCALDGSANGVTQKVGLYKANADSSPADEGAFGYAGYTLNDDGNTASGEMSSSGGNQSGNSFANPDVIRIGEDDRIYWADGSYCGAVVACDILATTNQLVINSGPNGPWGASPGYPSSPNNYGGNPDVTLLDYFGVGVEQFDVVNAGKTNAAIYLADLGDYPNWGIWMYHLTNGAADPADTVGTQALFTTNSGTDFIVTGGGVMVDYKQDVFASELRSGGSDPYIRTVLYTNWNGGVLPPEGGQTNYALGVTGNPPYRWGVGSSDPFMTGIYDTVINSRSNPTLVAVSMVDGDAGDPAVAGGYQGANGGIRILSAADGSTVVTNLDFANWYHGVAWDNVGNVYGASTSANYWRVWSPPGTNAATTVAVGPLNLYSVTPPTIRITSINVSGSTVTINFTAPQEPTTAFHLLSAPTANGTYSTVAGATISQNGPGAYQAVTTKSGLIQFYSIVMSSHGAP